MKLFLISLMLLSGSVFAKTQTIAANDGNAIVLPNATDFAFDIVHTTDDLPNLKALSFKMFYDSSVLEWKSNNNVLATNTIFINSDHINDNENLDGDVNTDKYFGFAWGNSAVGQAWGILNPQTLFNANFTWRNDSSKIITKINFSDTEPTNGYSFSPSPINSLSVTGPCGTCADASNTTISKDTAGDISVDQTAQFSISIKDMNNMATDNLGGKTLSLVGLTKGNINFADVANGVVIATYTPDSFANGGVSEQTGLQFKLGTDDIGSAQNLKITAASRTLTISTAANGSVTSNPVGQEFLQGTAVTLTATADSGFVFADWGGACSGTSNPLDYTITSDVTCSASFDIDTDNDGIANSIDTDDDGDGMPDIWESANGLNPLVDDSSGDLDGDGLNNLDEYNSGTDSTDPSKDNVPPVLSKGDKPVLNAKGKRTVFVLSAFGVSATDVKDGGLTPSVQLIDGLEARIVNSKIILTSGRHTLTWRVNDAAGNSKTLEQIVDVLPMANFAIRQATSEGQTATISVFLSGDAPSYPVTIPFTINGDVDASDYNFATQSIVINSGKKGSIDARIIDNADSGKEDMILTMGVLTGAVKGRISTHKITIIDENIAPHIKSFNVVQNGVGSRVVELSDQAVSVSADVFDANGDSLSYVWESAYLLGENAKTSLVSFNPSTLGLTANQTYGLKLILSDASSSVERVVKIRVVAPVTLSDADSDGDGTSDKVEGKGDADGNGIPDHKEKPHRSYELGAGDGNIIGAVGTRLLVGDMGDDSGKLTVAKMKAYRTENGLSAFQEDSYSASEVYDYKIEQLPEIGDTTKIVIETSAIAKNSVLRKYNLNSNSWSDFITDVNNSYYSAIVVAGSSCPQIGSADWSTINTLLENGNCLQIVIEDGGANDADGFANGSIEDPVAIASNSSTSVGSSSSGGGCVYNPNTPARFDMVFVLLSLLSVYYLLRRKRRTMAG